MLLFFFVVFLSVCLYKWQRRYIHHKPTRGGYPDNQKEVKLVEKAVSERTPEDVENHILTDESVVPMFLKLLGGHGIYENEDRLKSIILHPDHQNKIMKLKHLHNRARPWQVNPRLDVLFSSTAHTPAFPAGHAYQAWILYKDLASRYPHLDKELYDAAAYCDRVRVLAGLHYPSDGQYSKVLAEIRH